MNTATPLSEIARRTITGNALPRGEMTLIASIRLPLDDLGNALRVANVCAEFQRRLRSLRQGVEHGGTDLDGQRPTLAQLKLQHGFALFIKRFQEHRAGARESGVDLQRIKPGIGQQGSAMLRRAGFKDQIAAAPAMRNPQNNPSIFTDPHPQIVQPDDCHADSPLADDAAAPQEPGQ